MNIRSAKFVETIITDAWGAGFKNYDNIKPGHRNIYVNGGENHPHCKGNKGPFGPQVRKQFEIEMKLKKPRLKILFSLKTTSKTDNFDKVH